MAEKINGSDYLPSLEHWDGHTFERDCCPPRETEQKKNLLKLPGDILRAGRLIDQSRQEIRDFMSKGEERPTKTFTYGMEFDSKELHDGTIFKVGEEALWKNWPFKGLSYEWISGYGVINHDIQIKSNPDFGLLYFIIHDNVWLSEQPSVLPPQFTIGEVIHLPLRLERPVRIQILGNAGREPARQPSLVLSSQRG